MLKNRCLLPLQTTATLRSIQIQIPNENIGFIIAMKLDAFCIMHYLTCDIPLADVAGLRSLCWWWFAARWWLWTTSTSSSGAPTSTSGRWRVPLTSDADLVLRFWVMWFTAYWNHHGFQTQDQYSTHRFPKKPLNVLLIFWHPHSIVPLRCNNIPKNICFVTVAPPAAISPLISSILQATGTPNCASGRTSRTSYGAGTSCRGARWPASGCRCGASTWAREGALLLMNL